MINPLLVASDGYIKSPTPLSIYAEGYLQIGVIIPPTPTPEVVKRSSRGRSKQKSMVINDILIREDEEIMVIIKAFVECQ